MKVYGTKIVMTRGDTETLTFELQDEQGVRIDLIDGDMVYFTVKARMGTRDNVFQKTVDTFTNGIATIEILHADTSELSYKTYVYDIQVSRLNGTWIKTPVIGEFVISGDVTTGSTVT